MLALSISSSIMHRWDRKWKDSVILSAPIWHHRPHLCRPLHKHLRGESPSRKKQKPHLCCFVPLRTKNGLVSGITITSWWFKQTFFVSWVTLNTSAAPVGALALLSALLFNYHHSLFSTSRVFISAAAAELVFANMSDNFILATWQLINGVSTR